MTDKEKIQKLEEELARCHSALRVVLVGNKLPEFYEELIRKVLNEQKRT